MKLLFTVFSGHSSAIFDQFLLENHRKYIDSKISNSIFDREVKIIETQWDNGGHTGFLLEFNQWLELQDEFTDLFKADFLQPPPMGDLKSQVSRWSKLLIENDSGKTISSILSNKHKDLENAVIELKTLVRILQKNFPDVFILEERLNFLNNFIDLYTNFVSILKLKIEINHSVGNLFLNYLYYYSYLNVDFLDTIYEHHHEAFFNFLKDLSLVPRGIRIEFLIDGKFNLNGESEDGVRISSEKFFDEYPSLTPVKLSSYEIKIIEGREIENKFIELCNFSELIIIPPGSLSNWMPLINKFSKEIRTKPIIWFVNSFIHYSEQILENQINHLLNLGINPLIIAPKLNNVFDELNSDERGFFETSYSEQGKKAINFNEVFSKFSNIDVLRILPMKELEAGEGGLKYNSSFVGFSLDKLASETSTKDLSRKLIKFSSEFQKSNL